MKIASAQADPDALPHGLKDVVVRATRWGVVVQAKPRKGTQQWTKAQKQQRQRFGLAGRMASNPVSLDLRTAIEMAKGTQQVPRDVLTMAAMGQYYILANPDGTAWRRTTTPFVDLENGPPRPALQLGKTVWPPDPEYLVLDNGGRLALTVKQ